MGRARPVEADPGFRRSSDASGGTRHGEDRGMRVSIEVWIAAGLEGGSAEDQKSQRIALALRISLASLFRQGLSNASVKLF
jgi:hypothetical protein